MTSSSAKQFPLKRIAIALILLVSLCFGVVFAWPNAPSWRSPLDVPRLGKLREIRKTGLTLPQSTSTHVLPLKIGGHSWVAQDVAQGDGPPAALLVRPQSDAKDKPYVDWADLNGFFDWQRDAIQTLTVQLDGAQPPSTVKGRWFIARDPQDTEVVHFPQRVAVVQWYGFAQGGHHSTLVWFLHDQWAQLFGQRVPWIAVCLRLPVDPGVPLAETEASLTALVQEVQGTIEANLRSLRSS